MGKKYLNEGVREKEKEKENESVEYFTTIYHEICTEMLMVKVEESILQ